VEHVTLGLGVVGSSPTLGVEITLKSLKKIKKYMAGERLNPNWGEDGAGRQMSLRESFLKREMRCLS